MKTKFTKEDYEQVVDAVDSDTIIFCKPTQIDLRLKEDEKCVYSRVVDGLRIRDGRICLLIKKTFSESMWDIYLDTEVEVECHE